MEFRILPPADVLKDYVRYFWIWENARADVPQTFRPVADGCHGLIFQPTETDTFQGTDGKRLTHQPSRYQLLAT